MDNDPDAPKLEDLADDELLALAFERGISDEYNRDRLIQRLRVGDVTEQAPSPPPRRFSPVRSSSPSLPPSPPPTATLSVPGSAGAESTSSASTVGYGKDANPDADNNGNVTPAGFPAAAGVSMSAAGFTSADGVAAAAIGASAPPTLNADVDRVLSPMLSGSSPSSLPSAPPQDDDFDVGVKGGTRAAASAATALGDGGSMAEKKEMVDTFVGVTQVARSKAVTFLQATDWSIDAALNLFMESGGDGGAAAAAAEATGDAGGATGSGARGASDAFPSAGSIYRADEQTGGMAGGGGGVGGWRSGGGTDDYEGINDNGGHPDLGLLGEALPGLVLPPQMAAARAAHTASRRSAGRRSDDSSGSASGSSGGDAGPHDPLYPNGYSEDGVRAPDSNRRDTLIGGADLHGAGGRGILGALHGAVGGPSAAVEEKDNTDWIFAPPEGLSLPASFVDTRQICKEQKKWLIVNIQDPEQFASHRLNKDVWSNETIVTLVRGNFIFWQRNKNLGQARYYIDKYNLLGEVLPHTAIIDPRTGTQLVKVVGYVEPEDLSMALVEFLENNSLDQVRAPKLKTIGLGNIAHSGYGDSSTTKGSDGRRSPDGGGGDGSAGDASYGNMYESFGSEEYVYEDDDGDELLQGSSVDGDDNNSRISRASTNTSTAVAVGGASTNNESASLSPPPTSPLSSRRSSPSTRETRGVQDIGEAVAAAGEAELLGPWGHGTPEDEARARANGELPEAAPSEAAGVTEEGSQGAVEAEVPPEPDAGNGVTQVRFRMPSGATPATISRRFWMKDRVSILFQYVRNTVQDASNRPFDLLSGHPPSSLSLLKQFTLEDANVVNSAIMVRWA